MVKTVSSQVNWPEPKITRTIWARKTKSKTEAGIIKNKIWRVVLEKLWINSFLSSLIAKDASVGKAAMAKEMPKIPTGKICRLFARLNIAKDPRAKVEAIIVMTTRFNWLMAKVKVLGTIILPIFLIASSLKL